MKKRCIHASFFPAWHQRCPSWKWVMSKPKRRVNGAGPGRYFQINSIDRRDFKCPQC